MTTSGGSAQPVSVDTDAVQTGGPALPVAVVSDGRASVGGPATPVYVVTSGPVMAGPAMPVVVAPAGTPVAGGPAVPVYVVSGSLGGLPPVNTVLPAISGTLAIGQVLSTTDGTWTGSPTSYAYQWKRNGTDIGGATANTYTLTASDPGTTITVTVTATNAAGSASATSAGSAVSALLSNLISRWQLGEASGNRIDSISENHLSPQNAPGNAAGKNGNALLCVRASSQYCNRADNASLTTGAIDFSFAGWFWLNSTGINQAIAGKWASAGAGEWLLHVLVSNQVQFIVTNQTTSANATVTASSVTLVTGQWYFVAAWQDRTSNTINVQINDGTVHSAAWSNTIQDSAVSFSVGANEGPGRPFDGRLNELLFAKRIWTSAERTSLYAGGAGAFWPF